MKKILLAVDGISPDPKAFRYAVELCKRIKAELNVFQIIDPGKYSEYLKKMRKGTGRCQTDTLKVPWWRRHLPKQGIMRPPPK